MLSGDVNDNVRMTTICRKQPWDKEMLIKSVPSFDHICADCWGSTSVKHFRNNWNVIKILDRGSLQRW